MFPYLLPCFKLFLTIYVLYDGVA